MHGPECPYCGKQTNYGSTINGYPFECETCDIRFGNKGSLMHKDWRYMSDPDYTCLECGWSEKETRVSGLHGAAGIEGTPWQRYRVHLFLKHDVPLPDTPYKTDVKGVLIDGE